MKKSTFITVFIMTVLAVLVALPMALAQSGGSSGGAGPTASELQNPAPGDWPTFGRTLEMTRYSPLTQINTNNVSQLQLSWSRGLGFAANVEFSPVEYDGILYANSPDTVLALNATSGNLIWEYKVTLNKLTAGLHGTASRGGVLVYDGNVYATTGDGRVVALNRTTGKLVWSVQVGNIKLGEGFSSEPIFADGKIVVGPSGADTGGVPGRIVALNPTNGKVVWTFNVIPQPGQPGFNSWQPPTAAQWGGGSSWTDGAYDPQTNTIVWGTGNPTPWYSKGVRTGANLYTDSHVGLDASTGKLKWYHQDTPNDEWDQDEITIPTITNLMIDGQQQHVAILPLTAGFVNIVDAGTGKFLKSYNVYKEQTGKEGTVILGFKADGTPIVNQDNRAAKAGDSVPWCPSRWTSFDAAAYSPKTGLYYRPNSLLCNQLTAKHLPSDWQPGQSTVGDVITSLPDKSKRLGGISAIDPTTGKIVWQHAWPYDEKVGVVATAGDLVFVPSPDRVFRAYDAKTGDMLWQQVLPATMSSDAITYEVNGTQYVAVPDGGIGTVTAAKQSSAPAQVTGTASMFVFALPKAAQ